MNHRKRERNAKLMKIAHVPMLLRGVRYVKWEDRPVKDMIEDFAVILSGARMRECVDINIDLLTECDITEEFIKAHQ